MFKLTLQHLCLKRVIEIEQRWILVNRRDKRKHQRFFFKQGRGYREYSTDRSGEQFILEFVEQFPEFRFYQLRQFIKDRFGKKGTDRFKSGYVLKDMRSANLTFLHYFPNQSAKKGRDDIRSKIDRIDREIDHLTVGTGSELAELLHDLDTNVLFLKKETIKKLKAVSTDVLDIKYLLFFEALGSSLDQFDTLVYAGFGAFEGEADAFGFDGFGGGDFGGGGAFGDW